MKATFTPGPWTIDGDDLSERTGSLLGVYIAKVNDGRVAQTFCNCLVVSDEECRANALLIAAAPDLLAALIAMQHEFGRTYLPGSSPAVDAARAAIAKAIGETP